MDSKRSLVLLLATLLLVTACGDSAEPESLAEAAPGSLEIEVTKDLVFHQGDERFRDAQGLVDVVAPSTGGPWPVVVAFYGGLFEDMRYWMMPMVNDIAGRGRVVFLPAWGLTSPLMFDEISLTDQFGIFDREIACAVAFAEANAPDHITLFGYSGGANAALMAGLSHVKPLETCVPTGPRVVPNAVVSVEGDAWLGTPIWDERLLVDPEGFYGFTPWRLLDGSTDFPIHILAADTVSGEYVRTVGADPYDSYLADRHPDGDIVADLTEMGLLDDGSASSLEGLQWAHKTLVDAGYDARWLLLPDSQHGTGGSGVVDWGLSDAAWALVVDTVVHAESG